MNKLLVAALLTGSAIASPASAQGYQALANGVAVTPTSGPSSRVEVTVHGDGIMHVVATPRDMPTGPLAASLDLRAGPGVILMFVATALKAVDVLLHAIVPTPRIRHAPPMTLPGVGELPLYLRQGEGAEATRWGYSKVGLQSGSGVEMLALGGGSGSGGQGGGDEEVGPS